jgi:hypothetical protein
MLTDCVYLQINGEYFPTQHPKFGFCQRDKYYMLIHDLCEFQVINGEA